MASWCRLYSKKLLLLNSPSAFCSEGTQDLTLFSGLQRLDAENALKQGWSDKSAIRRRRWMQSLSPPKNFQATLSNQIHFEPETRKFFQRIFCAKFTSLKDVIVRLSLTLNEYSHSAFLSSFEIDACSPGWARACVTITFLFVCFLRHSCCFSLHRKKISNSANVSIFNALGD